MILSFIVGLIGSAAAGAANAQTGTIVPPTTPKTDQMAARPTPTGPVLRRQPRAADVPPPADGSSVSPQDRESLEDEALNRRINGICRGC
jgi:hypothetical protein